MEMLLTVEQAAERLQLAPYTVREQLKRGALRGIKRGRVWRVPESALTEAAPSARAQRYANLKGSPIFPPDLSRQAAATPDADRRARLARLRGSVKGRGPTVEQFIEERQAEATTEAGL